VFRAAYALQDANGISQADRATSEEQLAWFSKHLPIPTRFNRSKSKGYYRRKTKGIAWLRDDALENISRMYELRRVLEANGRIHVVLTADPFHRVGREPR
jgi:hypothetical protein